MTDLVERPIPAHEVRTGDRLALNQQLVTHVTEHGDEVVFHHARGHTQTARDAKVRVQRWVRTIDHDRNAITAWTSEKRPA